MVQPANIESRPSTRSLDQAVEPPGLILHVHLSARDFKLKVDDKHSDVCVTESHVKIAEFSLLGKDSNLDSLT